MKKLTSGIEENKKTLALLLAKILNPQVMMPSGFNIQTASINTSQGSVALSSDSTE